MKTQKKNILIIYHSQGGTMQLMASRFAKGAEKEINISVTLKKTEEAALDDLLKCSVFE